MRVERENQILLPNNVENRQNKPRDENRPQDHSVPENVTEIRKTRYFLTCKTEPKLLKRNASKLLTIFVRQEYK